MHTLPFHLLNQQARRPRPITVTHVAATTVADDAPATISDTGTEIVPVPSGDRSGNKMRPATLDAMVGQEEIKPLLRDLIGVARTTGRPLSHTLMIGAAGTGKTTTALVIANELDSQFFELEAPVSTETLLALRTLAKDGDVVFIDEIHQQSRGDRRGKVASMEPEAMYRLLEDFQIVRGGTVLPYPRITVIGATTDPGLLPTAFLDRFALQPRLARYTDEEMAELARRNADALGMTIEEGVADIFGRAARAVPRIVNRYMSNAQSLAALTVDRSLAVKVVTVLNGTTLDGLTPEMQTMLRFLLTQARTVRGEVRYQAGLTTIAAALGYSRDTKGVSLHVEPYLVERGLIQVVHGGRILTPAGVERARQLS